MCSAESMVQRPCLTSQRCGRCIPIMRRLKWPLAIRLTMQLRQDFCWSPTANLSKPGRSRRRLESIEGTEEEVSFPVPFSQRREREIFEEIRFLRCQHRLHQLIGAPGTHCRAKQN